MMAKHNSEYREEHGWVVIQENYPNRAFCHSGTFSRTRNEAKAYYAHLNYDTSPYVFGNMLTDQQKKAWDKCAARGARVVRATLVWKP